MTDSGKIDGRPERSQHAYSGSGMPEDSLVKDLIQSMRAHNQELKFDELSPDHAADHHQYPVSMGHQWRNFPGDIPTPASDLSWPSYNQYNIFMGGMNPPVNLRADPPNIYPQHSAYQQTHDYGDSSNSNLTSKDKGMFSGAFAAGSFGGLGTTDFQRISGLEHDVYLNPLQRPHCSTEKSSDALETGNLSSNSNSSTTYTNVPGFNQNTNHSNATEESVHTPFSVPASEVVDGVKKRSYSEITKSISKDSSLPKQQQAKFSSMSSSQAHGSKRLDKPSFQRARVRHDDTLLSVKPNSKYGLDEFEDPSALLKERVCRQQSSSSLPRSRKGSGSSVCSDANSEDLVRGSGNSSLSLSSPSAKGKKNSRVTLQDEQSSNKNATKLTKKQKSNQEEKPFFDPTRIFQPKKKSANDSIPNNQSGKNNTVLNNGVSKPSNMANCKSSSANYINNDLRQSKRTNMQSQNQESKEMSDSKAPELTKPKSHQSNKPRGDHGFHYDFSPEDKGPGRLSIWMKESFDYLGEITSSGVTWCKWLGYEVGLLLWNLALLVIKCTLLLCLLLVQFSIDIFRAMWHFLRAQVPRLWGVKDSSSDSSWNQNRNFSSARSRQQGLDENITLPASGEEAMKRLLSCRGKDPYSILGLTVRASDDDVRKYYRRQAVLVHPDKNKEPGAEEAFKILGHAFELIGEPDKRKQYDLKKAEATETEAAMQEFADLLTKLHEKMQEAANTMQCDACGGKHRRVPVDRAWYSSRYCDRCAAFHSAKEGDVWAESKMLGFLWHYYACMEGKIYDITEWASCQDHFKHIQSNAHHVIYRIATNSGRKNPPQRTNEPDLEDIIHNLFRPGAADSSSQATTQAHQAKGQANNTNKRRKKKKRH